MYNAIFEGKINEIKESGLYRNFVTLNRIRGRYPLAQLANDNCDDPIVVWCSNDYLGMSQHEGSIAAACDAINKYGVGSGGSRNIGGTHHHYVELERSLADLHNKEAALVFPTGYGSNDATLQCLLRLVPDMLVFSDAMNHASIINGIRSTSVEREVFRHNDLAHLEALLQATPIDRPKLIVFESIYSMDGDMSPVREIIDLAKTYNAMTFLDEVHAVGMYGPRGSGYAAQLGIDDQVDIIQGTMAKALGVIGGYIAGNGSLIDSIRSYSSGFIFTTSLPPSTVSACLYNVEHLKSSEVERRALHEKTEILRKSFDKFGILVMKQSTSHILPV